MIDQRTANFALPKPHPANQLDDDVARLRDAIDAIDGLLFWAAQRIDSDDPLGTISALVDALKGVQADLYQVVPADSATYTYDIYGSVVRVAEALPGGVSRVTDYVYANGALASETVVVGGVSRRTSYVYAGGLLTSVSRVLL